MYSNSIAMMIKVHLATATSCTRSGFVQFCR